MPRWPRPDAQRPTSHSRWLQFLLRLEQDLLVEMHPHLLDRRLPEGVVQLEEQRRRLEAAANRGDPTAAPPETRQRQQEALLMLVQHTRKQMIEAILNQ